MATSSSGQGLSQRHCGVLQAPADPRFQSTGYGRDDKPIPCTRPTACSCFLFSLALADGYLRFKWTQRGNGASTYSGVVYMADDFSVTMPPSRLIYLALVAPAPYSHDRQCMRPRGLLPPIATVPAPPSGPAHAESHSTAICIAYHCNLRQPGPDGMSPPAVCLALTAAHRVVGVTVGEPRATGIHGSPAGQRLWLRLLHILDDLLDGVASVVCGDRQLAELGGQFNLRSRRAMSRFTLEGKGARRG